MDGAPDGRNNEFGMKFERWRKAAQKAGQMVRRVEDGVEAFTRKWHDPESCRKFPW